MNIRENIKELAHFRAVFTFNTHARFLLASDTVKDSQVTVHND